MPKAFFYPLQWPQDDLSGFCYAHELYNYRYHWHDSDYELCVLLSGRAEFCSGQNAYDLQENDVILINPGVWHASFSRDECSRALVFRFSDTAFGNICKRGERVLFQLPPSQEQTRQERIYKKLRYYAALLLFSMEQKELFQPLAARAAFEMLLATICEAPFQVEKTADPNRKNREAVQQVIQFIDQHYAEKLSLDDVGQYIHYNRTYVSTLFKNTMGINFHDYLTRVRLSVAIDQLATTEKNITQIAIDCGFSDLKTFNHRFRSVFGYLPAEYRQRLNPSRIMRVRNQQVYVSPRDPEVAQKLEEFLAVL